MDIKRDTSGKKKKQILYAVVGGAALIAMDRLPVGPRARGADRRLRDLVDGRGAPR